MKFVKFAPKEKTEEKKLREVNIKQHAILSCAFRLLSDKYPEKFGEKINGSIDGKNIMLKEDLDVFETEVYDKVIEYNKEKESYKIIL